MLEKFGLYNWRYSLVAGMVGAFPKGELPDVYKRQLLCPASRPAAPLGWTAALRYGRRHHAYPCSPHSRGCCLWQYNHPVQRSPTRCFPDRLNRAASHTHTAGSGRLILSASVHCRETASGCHPAAVSYTHLDVYKRQASQRLSCTRTISSILVSSSSFR